MSATRSVSRRIRSSVSCPITAHAYPKSDRAPVSLRLTPFAPPLADARSTSKEKKRREARSLNGTCVQYKLEPHVAPAHARKPENRWERLRVEYELGEAPTHSLQCVPGRDARILSENDSPDISSVTASTRIAAAPTAALTVTRALRTNTGLRCRQRLRTQTGRQACSGGAPRQAFEVEAGRASLS